MSILLHAGIACPASLSYDWVVTNGCFNPFSVSSYNGRAHSTKLEEWLTDIKTAADLTSGSQAKLAKAKPRGLTCMLVMEASYQV